jgi:3D (Asp-Asp-Asp) domain-containing protein
MQLINSMKRGELQNAFGAMILFFKKKSQEIQGAKDCMINKKNAFKILSVLSVLVIFASSANIQAVEAKSFGILPDISSLFTQESFPETLDKKPVKTIKVVATAYNSLEGQTDNSPCVPAMVSFNLCEFYEENGYGNSIAANFLPLGTHVRFPDLYGDKVFVVRDRLNAKYGYGRIDMWLPDYDEAKLFGVKRIKMEIF